jgi:GntR family transcriptional regulator/MocR family aminotransferase
MQNSTGQRRRVSLAGIRLDRASSVALPQQIAAQMRDGILHGTLPAGTQFLGSREIARELGCSRMVVLSAWDILYAEGYLESMPRGGVSVAAVSRNAASPAGVSADTSRIAGPISQRWQSLIGFTYETNWASDFSPGAPDISTFPFGDWARLLRQTSLQPDRGMSRFVPRRASRASARDRGFPRRGTWSRLHA